MQPTIDQFAGAVAAAACDELTKALGRIKHCVDQLTDEQVWRRSAETMRAIGNWSGMGACFLRRTRERIHVMSRLPRRMKAVIIIVTGVLPLLDSVRIGRTRLAFLRMGVVPRSRRFTPMRRPLAIGMNPVESFVVASRFRIKGPKTMRRDVEARRRRVISRGPHVIRG